MSAISTESPDQNAESWAEWLKVHPNSIRVTAVVIFFLFWEVAARHSNPMFMTYPSAIVKACWELTLTGELPQALLASAIPFFAGLAISIVAGIAIGIAMGQSWLLEYVMDPFVNAF